MESDNIKSQLASDLLVFVVGKSGSGKDTIMRLASNNLFEKQIPVNIVQRYITRPSDETENSLYISETQFLQKKAKNEFALSWYVYNNWYGCPRMTLEEPLQRGEIVLVNVSRSILYEARKKYPQSKIILIEVENKVAETRLKVRGRENTSLLHERINRMHEKIDIPLPDIVIHNNGDLNAAVHEMSEYLEKIYQSTKKIDC
ncbi:MAG: hypothetical protein JSW11_04615 [Candidatus Heimdallarchaeota archaeon]|nr:MAG: hypothetical protein JSW11_04615 [Candidatus Heimdallarchaeota archaeon]